MLPLNWTPSPPFNPSAHPIRKSDSLTARLAKSGRVSVDVLASGWDAARPDEAAKLGLRHAGQRLYAREVCLRRDNIAAVFARSVTTIASAKGLWKGLPLLGNKPLATLLWTNPLIYRGPFEFSRISFNDPLLCHFNGNQSLLARRSSFWLQGQQLIVLEAFIGLPWPTTADSRASLQRNP